MVTVVSPLVSVSTLNIVSTGKVVLTTTVSVTTAGLTHPTANEFSTVDTGPAANCSVMRHGKYANKGVSPASSPANSPPIQVSVRVHVPGRMSVVRRVMEE